MEMTEKSARLVGRLMGSIKATDEDAIVVGLVLGTEENTQEFFRWYRSLKKDPTPQECFEKTLEISGLMEKPEEED